MDDDLLEAMLTLLKVFDRRYDLQREFPEILSKNYRRLLEWSLGVTQKKWMDSDYDKLKSYSAQFETLLLMKEIRDPVLEDWRRKHISNVKRPYMKKFYDFIIWTRYLLFGEVPLPEFVMIDPSNICNLKCPLCPSGIDKLNYPKKFMDKKILKTILKKLPNIKNVEFCNWGEPLLNPDIIELIKYIKNKNVGLSIHTNLNVVKNDNFFNSIVESGLDSLIISIDGASERTYTRYRINGNFDLVISNIKKIERIKKIQGKKNPRLTWQFIVNRYNEHEVMKAKNMASSLGIEFVTIKIGLSDDLPDMKFNESIEQRKKKWLPENEKHIYNHYIGKYQAPLYNKPCDQLFQRVIINPDGKIFPCCWITDEKNVFGDLLKDTFYNIWNNQKYRYSRRLHKFSFKKCDNLPRPTICYYCKNYRKSFLSKIF